MFVLWSDMYAKNVYAVENLSFSKGAGRAPVPNTGATAVNSTWMNGDKWTVLVLMSSSLLIYSICRLISSLVPMPQLYYCALPAS